jgi:hypothetical protein
MDSLSDNACKLLDAIGNECKKESVTRDNIESTNLHMKREDFIDAFTELSDAGLLMNGAYDHIVDNNLNPKDDSNVWIKDPCLTELGQKEFEKL